jgi:DNA polymerase-4
MVRLIAHVDMDAFYAAVEVLDHPELAGRPVIVGGTSKRGVVSSASYEARAHGVRSAMPTFEAKRLCPEAVFRPVRMVRYKEISEAIMDLLAGFAPFLEVVSVDEAFLDLTGTSGLYGPPEAAGRRLKELIKAATGLTCSVGLAPNKLLAKIASDLRKPDGLVVVAPESAAEFIAPLPVRKLPGVGPRSAQRLAEVGVSRVADLRRFSPEELTRLFGAFGPRLAETAWGRDDRPLEPPGRPKSISAEETLEEDTANLEILQPLLAGQALRVGRRLRRHGLLARTVVLKLKHRDFKLVSRSLRLPEPTADTQAILQAGLALLRAYGLKVAVRLIGLGLANLEEPGPRQAGLFPWPGQPPGRPAVDQALDQILSRYGSQAIKLGLALKKSRPPL